MATAELAIALLWHMHQPDYVDSLTGRAALPWVRLHAQLSYYDMVRLVRESPDTRVVLNVVPSLLRQLAAAAGGAEDEFLALARAEPGDLSGGERALLVQRFFAFHHGRRFAELPRLGELWRKREGLGGRLEEAAGAFSDAELRDLQVGFQLAWSGRTLREDPLVAALFRKGRGFTAREKGELLARQQAFLAEVLPAYRDAARAGAVEISCTPYAHPILPLLCDARSAREALPELPLPASGFARPGDAWFHVEAALAETERWLGQRPRGMWPAEGSVSEAAVRVWQAAGVRWLASDQGVLAASLAGQAGAPGGHCRAWRWGGDGAPCLFFRDHGLSDRIGFVYASWPAERAVADFVGHLQRLRESLPAGRWLVPVILDGENAWEAYANLGADFLRGLYAAVAAAPGLRWTTFGAHLDDPEATPPAPLSRLRAGSWIRSDFTTWIGHPEKNRAWERLAATREWLEPRLAAGGALATVTLPDGAALTAPDPARLGPAADSPLARAWLALAAAEGSDWFWWYGDDNPTDFAREFDELFRTHLANVHRHLGEEPPPSLAASLRDGAAAARPRPPRAPLEITLDGEVSHYFEWLDAGRLEVRGVRGAMQQVEVPVSTLWYGGDPRRLWLRLDPAAERGAAALAGRVLRVQRAASGAPAEQAAAGAGPAASAPASVVTSVGLRLPEAPDGRGDLLPLPGPTSGGGDGAGGKAGLPVGCSGRVIEVGVPWESLGAAPGQELAFFVTLEREGGVELRIPAEGALPVRAPLGPDDPLDWIV